VRQKQQTNVHLQEFNTAMGALPFVTVDLPQACVVTECDREFLKHNTNTLKHGAVLVLFVGVCVCQCKVNCAATKEPLTAVMTAVVFLPRYTAQGAHTAMQYVRFCISLVQFSAHFIICLCDRTAVRKWQMSGKTLRYCCCGSPDVCHCDVHLFCEPPVDGQGWLMCRG
jgi:hypothetical protein